MPETSIVIRSFNEAENIGDVFSSLESQAYSDFEIILVDSGSTDGTLEIAEQYVDKVEFVSPKNFTFGYSCNVGCKAASGRFVSFLSAHAIPTDDQWLGTMVDNLRDDSVAMTYSNQIGASETKFSEKRLFNQLFPEERKHQTPPEYFANNASSVIKKELWEDHKFDEHLTGHEDIEWAKHFMDQGYVVVYEPEACIYHIHDETWEQIFHRFEREAVADVEIGVRSPSDRWREYLGIPRDVLGDSIAALRQRAFSGRTFAEIVRFRYNQHMGTVSGLLSESNLESNRYDYFYSEANEEIIVDAAGDVSVESSPLPEIKPNEVLIQTDFIGFDLSDGQPPAVGTDSFPPVESGGYVGTVVELGANANSVAVGDTVVGETVFPCEFCAACDRGEYQACENPTTLGADTDVGPYARFFTAPSDHVYPLPDDIEPHKGVLVRAVAEVIRSLTRATELGSNIEHCAVIGDTPKARIAVQLLQADHFEVDHWDATNRAAVDPEFSTVQLVVDTTGDKQYVRNCVEQTPPGTIVLLLADSYNGLLIDDIHQEDKIVLIAGESRSVDVSDGISMLPALDTRAVLNGTYSLDELTAAWDAASDDPGLSVVSFETH